MKGSTNYARNSKQRNKSCATQTYFVRVHRPHVVSSRTLRRAVRVERIVDGTTLQSTVEIVKHVGMDITAQGTVPYMQKERYQGT